MTRSFFTLSLGIGAMLLATNYAFAQQGNCADHAAVTAGLAARYGEVPQAIAMTPNNMVLEIFAATTTGTWTITLTTPDGQTCLVAAGDAFEWLGNLSPNGDDDA